jgi:starch-binding outer membrane protein, SusD/RagB family
MKKFISLVAIGVGLTGLASCARSDLLGISTPDAITQQNLNSADGAEGLRVGAIQRFKLMTALDESSWFYGGLLVDEWKSADTFIQRDETDQRTVAEDNSLVTVAYRDIHRARVQAFDATKSLNEFKPAAKGEIGEMWFIRGYAELQSASDFCNGQPFADLSSGSPDLGTPLSGADAFKLALASFDSALAVVGSATDTVSLRVKYSAQVGRGRVFLGLGQQAQAGTAVAGIPKTFSFNLTWPGTQGKEDNLIWGLATSARRYTVQDSLDRQGGVIPNGMPFVSAKDPRVPTVANPKFGFDGSTPFDGQLVFPNFNSPVPVASYVDAQLILAESQLAANDAGWLATLNALRAGPTNIGAVTVTGMAPLTDPGNAGARVSLLFRERAFWTFGRGQRLGDLRREIRVYSKTAAQVFPGEGGINPRKNANYGPDVTLPVPQAERNNFRFGGCTDRKA